jgi:hypothetical protein
MTYTNDPHAVFEPMFQSTAAWMGDRWFTTVMGNFTANDNKGSK